jgi:signal transduction histidine kinase
MWWSGGVLIACLLAVLQERRLPADQSVVEYLASSVRLTIEGGAFLWAAARPDLPYRLRLALRISAWASLLAVVNYLALVPPAVGGPTILSLTVDSAMTAAGYLATVVALLIYPRAPARGGERVPLTIDAIVSAGGLGLLGWTVVTLASQERAGAAEPVLWIRVYGLAQLATIVGLNVVAVRGLAVPSPRAFWWFVAGQALYVPVTIHAQVFQAGLVPAWPGDFIYYLGVIPTLVACLWFRLDPMTRTIDGGRPIWLRDLNPIPLVIPAFLGVALVAAMMSGATTRAVALGIGLTVASQLLAVRLLLSARQAAALGRAGAERELQRQADRLETVGRLAGGIAHEFNRLLTRILGHADNGEASSSASPVAREHFAGVREAALGAARLTGQLEAFSGRRRPAIAPTDVDACVAEVHNEATRHLPAGIRAHLLRRCIGPAITSVDAAQLRAAVGHLLDNAVEAMPHGGALVVDVAWRKLEEPLPAQPVSAPAGGYIVVTVSDTGGGISPDKLALVCDPFYSTKPPHLGAGLGLAAVHGFVVAHDGGLYIDSTVGRGTNVALYLRT